MKTENNFDLIITGAGPAGMTAAIYSARKRLNVLITGKEIGGQAMYSSEVDNYLGYKYITGEHLVAKFEEHLKSFDTKLVYGEVKQLLRTEGEFRAVMNSGADYMAPAVIVASGKNPRQLGVPGEREYLGRGVAYCATCDAPFFEGLDVAVVGGGNSALDAAGQLIKVANKVYIIEFSDSLRADDVFVERVRRSGITEIILGASVKEIRGGKMVTGITIEDRSSHEIKEITVSGVFIGIGSTPAVDFISGIVDLNRNGEIIVDCACRTNVAGLFAAGDVTSVPGKQIIIAAGHGAQAALTAYEYLVRNNMLL
jgi:NADH-dependent peroxiredoxin subunit F